MKTKYLLFSTLVLAISAGLGSCRNKNNTQPVPATDSVQTATVQTPDTALYGKLGEGTGMSCIEIITRDGDTLTLNKTDENTGFSGKILGGTEHYNDPLTITTNASQESIITLVNLATLSRKWQTHPDSIELNLKSQGKVTGKWNGKNYNQWKMYNAQLILNLTGKNNQIEKTDTFEISDLNKDSLILTNKKITYKFYSK